MWDLIVSVPDHCSSFYFSEITFQCVSILQVHLYISSITLGNQIIMKFENDFPMCQYSTDTFVYIINNPGESNNNEI